MAKLDIRIKESGKDSLKIELGGRSRLLYFIIFILLSLTVFLSLDPAYDFSSSRIGGTIFTFLLILLSLAVTVIVRSFKIDKRSGLVEKSIGLPFELYRKVTKSYILGTNPKFIIKSLVHLYPESPVGGKLNSLGGQKKGKNKFTLCIETEEDTVILCDSNNRDEIDTVANYVASYLGYQVKNQD